MEAILSSDEVKGDPVGPGLVTASLQQIIMAISYLAKVISKLYLYIYS